MWITVLSFPLCGRSGGSSNGKALKETIGRLETLLEVQPEVVVCDLHPKYNSTVVAEELGLPVLRVQHHYAHILSCMAENDCEEKVIGVSFDGTGYGTDGTIWGGELLVADCQGFTRLGSIEPLCPGWRRYFRKRRLADRRFPDLAEYGRSGKNSEHCP